MLLMVLFMTLNVDVAVVGERSCRQNKVVCCVFVVRKTHSTVGVHLF